MRYLVWFFLIGVLGLLAYLGSFEPYREHLIYDVSVYYQRSAYFFDHGHLKDISNEYLPISTSYFLVLSPVLMLGNTLENFERALVVANSILILLIGWLIYRAKGSLAVWLFGGLVLCAGPIVLYRFEVLVILMMILSLLRFQKKDLIGSSIFLSLGLLVKLYPVLLLPYFLILSFKQAGFKQSSKYLGVFVFTTLGVILFYFITTQTGIKEFLFSLDFHKDKPVGLESPMAAFHHLAYYWKHELGTPIVARHNTWGVDDRYLLLPMPILTYLWLIPVAGMYLWLLFSKTKQASFLFVITFLSSFFIFSKLFTPQYWLWVLFLLPFLPAKGSYSQWVMISTAALATAIIQFIYPLHYFDFLAFFYSQAKQYEYLFWLYILEISCMITTAILALVIYIKHLKSSNLR